MGRVKLIDRVSAQQQGDQGVRASTQLGSRFGKWMSRSPMLFTHFTQKVHIHKHTQAHTLTVFSVLTLLG